MPAEFLRLYVGTYTLSMSFVKGRGMGIYTCLFDTKSGKLEKVAETRAQNPSYLALHPNGKYLYAVNEVSEGHEPTQDALSAYVLDEGMGVPQLLNQQPALGSSPCHVGIEPSGRFAYITTYVGGNVTAYPIGADGTLGQASDHVQHGRIGKMAHAHSINPTPSGDFALTCDLGLDCVFVYQLDLAGGKLIPWGEIELAAGSGPRHLAYHPNGRFVYVINELNGTTTALRWEAQAGKLTAIQTISTLPVDFSGPGWCADIHVHPSGRFVYGSNRGNHSIVIYRVNERDGKLSLAGFESTHGTTPRSFAIDPQGRWLLVANQDSDGVAVFRIDPNDGQLDYLTNLEIPTPVCLKFAFTRSRETVNKAG
jgi:6-phosphogluconolactonase